MRPNLSGNLSLTMTGKRTFQIAMPTPIKSVPAKSKNGIEMDRMHIPIKRDSKPNSNALSFVKRLASLEQWVI